MKKIYLIVLICAFSLATTGREPKKFTRRGAPDRHIEFPEQWEALIKSELISLTYEDQFESSDSLWNWNDRSYATFDSAVLRLVVTISYKGDKNPIPCAQTSCKISDNFTSNANAVLRPKPGSTVHLVSNYLASFSCSGQASAVELEPKKIENYKNLAYKEDTKVVGGVSVKTVGDLTSIEGGLNAEKVTTKKVAENELVARDVDVALGQRFTELAYSTAPGEGSVVYTFLGPSNYTHVSIDGISTHNYNSSVCDMSVQCNVMKE